ncbi:MAG: cyclic nucleotide-binding domain-containing protein [Proteobacteria bacterium]|nr:cyclic nucleotide-binding domain-containing protein [Pseudomonadota bacterium]
MSSSVQPVSLGNFNLFSTLTAEECAVLVPLFKETVFPAGTTFIKQDEISAQMYLIKSGIAEVKLPLIGPKGTTSVAKFGPNECVGELSLAKTARRAASAVAEVECVCLSVDTADLLKVFETHPRIGYQVFRQLAIIITDRLVATNMMLRNSASHQQQR